MQMARWLLIAGFVGTLGGCSGGDKDTNDTSPTTAGDDDDTVVGDDDDTVGDDDDTTTDECAPFELVGDGLPSAMLSIWGTSANDIYFVGPDDGTGPLVYHFDGASWTRLDTGTTGSLWWVWGDGQGTIWMSGGGARVIKYTEATGEFTEEVIGDPVFTLFGIWGSGPDDVFAVGADISRTRAGEVFHWDGAAWTSIYTIPVKPSDGVTLRNPFKVWGSGPDDVWVVGTDALTTHWDGVAFTEKPNPLFHTTTLFTVHGTGSDNVYVVGGAGNAAVIHWDGTAWIDETPPPIAIAPGFTGVFVDPVLGPVAAGNNGAVWLKNDAGEWESSCRPPATTWSFHAAWIDPDGGIWASGGDLINLDYGVITYGGNGSIPAVDGT